MKTELAERLDAALDGVTNAKGALSSKLDDPFSHERAPDEEIEQAGDDYMAAHAEVNATFAAIAEEEGS